MQSGVAARASCRLCEVGRAGRKAARALSDGSGLRARLKTSTSRATSTLTRPNTAESGRWGWLGVAARWVRLARLGHQELEYGLGSPDVTGLAHAQLDRSSIRCSTTWRRRRYA